MNNFLNDHFKKQNVKNKIKSDLAKKLNINIPVKEVLSEIDK